MEVEPNFNKLPKVTSFEKASAVFQQNYEPGFRSLTGKELVSEIKDQLEITGTALLPIPPGALPTPLADQIRTMEIVGPDAINGISQQSIWTHPTLPVNPDLGNQKAVSLVTGQRGTLFFTDSVWNLRNVQELPVADTSNLATKSEVNTVNERIDYEFLVQNPISTQAGFYYNIFTGLPVVAESYTTRKYDLNAIDNNESILLSGSVNGSPTALALYLDESNVVISYENRGTNGVTTPYTRISANLPDGARYLVMSTVAGAANSLVELASGSVLGLKNELESKISTVNNRVGAIEDESSTTTYNVISGVRESVNGYYHYNTGAFVESANYRSTKYDISSQDWNNLYLTADISGGVSALAIYLDSSNNFISYVGRGTNGVTSNYVKQKLSPPVGAKYIASSGVRSYTTLESTSKVVDIINRAKATEIANQVAEEKLSLVSSQWKDKRIWWCGTSIPAGGWPQLLNTMMGCNVINVAVGSSMARRGKIDQTDGYGWTGLAWQNVAYSLSQTLAEKNELINNWDLWKTRLGNSPPAALTEAQKTLFRSCSYELKLIPYLNGTNPMPDLFVLDHGHNDNLSSDSDVQYTTVPAVRNDRNYFLGAMNFLIDKILNANPRAIIVIIGHYENDRKARISVAQTNLSEYWDFPICKLWERLGWSQQTVQTTGYWEDSNTWIPAGGAEATRTITQIWMQDDLHPVSNLAKDRLANRVLGWFNQL